MPAGRIPERSPDRPGEERTVAPGVHQLALASPTLPPYDVTWLTLVRSGERGVLVDPGFARAADAGRVRAWTTRLGVDDVDRVLLTHAHRDHVAGLPALLDVFGALPVFAHPAELARVPAVARARPLGGGRTLVLGGATLRTHHVPGHAPGHLAFEVVPRPDPSGPEGPTGLVAGDVVLDGGAPWVGVPDGDVDAYLDSVARMRALTPAWLAPAHGRLPDDPLAALDAAAAHRRRRLEATAAALTRPMRLSELTREVYGDVPDAVRARVRAGMLANLVALMRALRVAHVGDDDEGPYAPGPGGARG